MARRKNDSNTLQAKEAIIESFWALLEDCSLNDLTVSQIALRSKCTRGTFYYHYADMGSLIHSAIENEVLGRDGAPSRIFSAMTATGATQPLIEFNGLPMYRMSLAMRRGGREIVEDVVTQAIMGMWKAVLCPDGEDLSTEAQIVVRYAICGILGLVRLQGENSEDAATAEGVKKYLATIVSVQLEQLCQAQSISIDELKLRLAIVCKFMTHDA